MASTKRQRRGRQRGPRPALVHRLGNKRIWLGALGFVVVLLAWYLVNITGLISSLLLPGPATVAHTFVTVLRQGYRGTTLPEDIAVTLYRGGAGYFLGCLLGIPLGLAMGYSKKIAAVFDLPIQFVRPLPPLAFFVLLILWFGTGDSSKIAFLFIAAFPIVATGTAAGVRSVRLIDLQAARSLGARDWQLFRHVVFPASLPGIFTSMRIAMGITFGSVVGAEILAATNGIGWMIFSASQFLRNDIVIMCVLILGIIGVLLNRGLSAIDARVVHWRGRA